MKFSIVHFEKPSSTNTTHNSSDNVLSFSQQNSLKHHSFSSNNASFSGGRKSPPNQKLVMTRRTEILEPLKKLDDLKQIQLSIIQQRLAQSNSSSQSSSRKSPESVHSSSPSSNINSTFNKFSISNHLQPLNSSTTKVAQYLLNQSIVSRRTVPSPQTIPSQHTHVILHSPVNTVHYEQATATLAIPIIYQHHQPNLQIPHNHHPMLIPNTIKYQSPQNYHHHPVNTPPKPACTVSCERAVACERPHAPSFTNPPHQHHAPSSLALQAKSAQEHSPHPPQYSKQTISKPSKMSGNVSCGSKIKRVSISFNELLNEDHEFKSSH